MGYWTARWPTLRAAPGVSAGRLCDGVSTRPPTRAPPKAAAGQHSLPRQDSGRPGASAPPLADLTHRRPLPLGC
eukprot:3756559-Lingulodinium_polyedra.AAC.1